MEDNSKNSKLSSKENADYDTFGSIDSLIFEPKIPVAVDAPSDCVLTSEITISASTDCLLDNALGEASSGSDPVMSALNLLNYDMRDKKENNQESERTYEESEEETPLPTPTPSTPRAESEQDLPVYDTEDEHHNVQTEINEIQQLCKAETSGLAQHPWPWVAAGQNTRQHTQGKPHSKEENQKLPFKQKFFKGLKELGFIKATSKESLKSSTVYDNTDVGKEQKIDDGITATSSSLQIARMSKLQSELESKQQKDMSGYESFKVNFQRLSGKRLPSEEESTYDYHPDHNEHLYHGDGTTTTSHDTADSETESITSLESVIFKGNIVEETDADMEEKKRKRNPFKHKFVVNHGNESDTSELIESKSLSFSTQPYLDSDTSWDYMEAMDEEKLAMQQYSAEGKCERNSIAPGPRVFGNLRRKHVYQSVENIERSVPSQSPEGENSKLQSLDSECVPTIEGIGDCSPSPSSAAVCQGLNLSQLDSSPSTDEESDGRRLFRAYQRRQFRTPSDPSRRDAGGSTSTASHEYEETGEAVYQICGGSISGSSQGHGTPPVVLLKHHVYQSIESLASRSGLSTATSIKTPPTDDALEELQFYGSRHGEPIYGARNSRLFHSMNGAFVARDNTDGSRDPPVVIRKGKVVELTEEMFKGTLEKMPHSPLNEKTEADISFHSTLVPSALQGDDCLYFQNTVSSTESREVHTYENDSEIYGTRKEIREELLQVSKEAVGDVKNELVPPHDAVMQLENKEGQEAAGGITYESTEKIKKVQKLGVSILGNNNDLMIRELKLKLRRRFNTGDDDEEEVDGKSPTLMKSPLKATVSVDTTSSVAFKREQLAPHMNKIFGSLHEKRRQTMENGDSRNDVIQRETCKIIAEPPESRNESKEEKQEKNEKEKCKEREVIRVGGNDGVIEQVFVPTPDYTPASTLPRDHHEDNYLSGFTDEEDFSFDLADLAKFVHEHITKNKTLYSDPGNDLPDGSRIEDTAAVDEEGGSGSPKRSVRFDMSKNLADLTATWSDLESVIFADENSALMETTENGKQENASLLSAGKLPLSRMESYKDDWLLWEQLAKMRRSKVPEDRERWEVEKTKRMLLWIHLSNNNYTQWCYRSQWWKAKQRASVAWIVQKAHKNKVPSDLQDPYYRDYEGAEHLKPGIVHRLANADLYCSALANIYGDPNFHNLSHWNIIQALARKGVYVAEPTDVALTETVLIQVSPIKMSAHLAVIEAMMALYIREVVVAERAVSVLQRVSGGVQPERTPQDQEEALVLWINHIAQALQERVHQQVQSQDQELPVFPRIQDLSDLSDGIGLAALIAFYCPQELPWGEIAVADPPSIADSLYNIGLVIRFCQESLPYNPCLLTKEDIVYMHSSVKQNVLAFVAELFFLLELEPVSCVSLPGTRKTSSKFIQLSSPGGGGCSGWSGYQRSMKVIPDLRASLSPSSAHSTASSSYSSARSSSHSQQRSPYSTLRGRGGVKSPSSGESGSGSGSGTGTGVRRQQSLTERDRPRKERISIHEAMKPAGAPSVRRSHSMNLNDMADMRSRMELRSERSEHAPSSYNSDYGGRDSSMSDGQEGDFVVQRSRGLATLSDMMRTQQSPRASQDFEPHYSSRGAAKERYNMDSKEEELGERSRGLVRRGSFTNSQPDLPAAGMPSRYEERPHGRSRSRRNSVSAEDSQLTIENFGGSQDNLNYISRNPDKEPFVHTGRRENTTWEGSQARESREGSARPESRGSRERSVERRRDFERSSIDELDNRLIDKLEREALEREKRDSSQYTSKEKLMARDPRKSAVEAMDSGSESDLSFDREKMSKATSFAELSKLKEQLPGGINIIYMQSDKEDTTKRSNKGPEKKTTFAALPNQTTWKQQSAQSHADDNKSVGDENMEPQIMASELHNVRLKLEEKRRRIESEKRKMEQAMNKQRQKLGKEAFMQAVVKGGKGSSTGSSTPTTSEPEALDVMVDSVEQSLPKPSLTSTATRPNTDLSLKDIGSDVNNLSRRWLEGEGQADELRTPDIDNMDYDEYHKSLTQMTDSLTEIQGDIQRLANQQQQIQSMMHNGMTPQTNQGMQQPPPHGQFYLHDQQGSPVRRMWGQQSSSDGYSSMSPATRRAQWGPVRPMMPQGDYMMSGQHPGYYQGYQMNHPTQMPPLSQVNTQQQMGGTGPGFMLHGQTQSHSLPPQAMYQNGQGYYSPEHQYRGYPPSAQTYASGDQRQMGQTPPFRLHGEGIGGEMRGPGSDGRGPGSLRSSAQSSPSRQPLQRQQKSPSPTRQTSVSHAPVAAPPPDDMEPQNVSFIESEDHPQEDPSERFKRLSITSGSKTYRISHEPGSPTRPSLGVKTFRVPTKKGTPVYDDVDLPQPTPPQRSITPPYQDTYRHGEEEEDLYSIKTEPLDGPKPEKGFYISFDSDSAPRKPKPQLRTKKMSRKNSSPSTPASTPSREELPVVPSSVSEMEKKKERLMMLSMKRKQEQEEARRRKEMEAQERKEAEKMKEEEKQRKKEEEKARREVILERYKIKKAMEEAEKEGRYYEPPPGFNLDPPSSAPGKQSVRMRNKPAGSKPRPKTMAHAPSASDSADGVLSPSQGKRGSTHNIAGEVGRRGESSGHGSMRKSSGRWGSSHSLSRAAGSRGSSNSLAGDYPSTTRTLERGHTGRRPTSVIGYSSIARGGESRKDSLYGSQGNGLNYHEGYHVHEARRPSLALEGSRMRRGSASSSYGGPSSGYRKYRSTGNLSGQSEHDSLVYHMSEDSGLGRATPPRRAPSPGMARHLPSPSGPGSLPPGLFSKRKQAGFDDAASDISSTASSTADYLGPRLFKQPTAKSNRTIILNAVEYCVFPGAVNQTAKHRVLEEIARSESKHFLVLFRDAGCQFRAIYSFNPETEEVYKLYGTGPKQVTDRMFDKFFKYNSGGKCFSQIHTKHLTVTIDAFTIHNSLWQGKRVNLPSKKDMTLVI
ncbi:patronin-like isoform X7 [Penaeus indicus]|uniref:patronin-like isoform X7 n=1 Tax=Penaeus indicus TaxID=29960 RepID=UPI00300D085E